MVRPTALVVRPRFLGVRRIVIGEFSSLLGCFSPAFLRFIRFRDRNVVARHVLPPTVSANVALAARLGRPFRAKKQRAAMNARQ
jgi:hypothetical protein